MTNLERLNLELSHQPYLSEGDFIALLEENGLDAGEEYTQQNRRKLLCAVLAILEILSNDLDLFRSIQTEFATTGAANEALAKRIASVKSEIARLDEESATATSCVSYLFRS